MRHLVANIGYHRHGGLVWKDKRHIRDKMVEYTYEGKTSCERNQNKDEVPVSAYLIIGAMYSSYLRTSIYLGHLERSSNPFSDEAFQNCPSFSFMQFISHSHSQLNWHSSNEAEGFQLLQHSRVGESDRAAHVPQFEFTSISQVSLSSYFGMISIGYHSRSSSRKLVNVN